MLRKLHRTRLALSLALTLTTLGVSAQTSTPPPFVQLADQIVWQADATTQRIEVHKDMAHGVHTYRVRIAPGTDLPPHGHAKGYRIVTVISGTLLLGFGTVFDETKLKSMPPGSLFSETAGHQHFARTLQEPVVLQLTEVLNALEAKGEAKPSGKKAPH